MSLSKEVLKVLKDNPKKAFTTEEISEAIPYSYYCEISTVLCVLEKKGIIKSAIIPNYLKKKLWQIKKRD